MSSSHPAILDSLGYGAPVELRAVGGGCIADAVVATFASGLKVFVKRHAGAPGMFESEAEGLGALGKSGAIRVPRVLAVAADSLVLEWIGSAPRVPGFSELFGQRFAALHGHRGPACGFWMDNYIGATPQPNRPLHGSWEDAVADDGAGWPQFYLERRLRFQAEMAARGDGGELLRLLDRAERSLIELLNEALEAPVLLHGDLWGGNYVVDERGEPCLIDPAVYFGHREADLAMTRLFGGFDRAFYAAYAEAAPLAPGHGERLPIYQLYHVINHFNLFGGGYHGQAKAVLRHYCRG